MFVKFIVSQLPNKKSEVFVKVKHIVCLYGVSLKWQVTLRNIDWHYTTSICLPVQADQYFKLDEAGQAIVQNQ